MTMVLKTKAFPDALSFDVAVTFNVPKKQITKDLNICIRLLLRSEFMPTVIKTSSKNLSSDPCKLGLISTYDKIGEDHPSLKNVGTKLKLL